MLKSGTTPSKFDKRDFEYHASYGTLAPIQWPDSYTTDSVPFFPNQEILDTSFSPPVVPLPYGCTDESQSAIATNLKNGSVLYRPDTLEATTHANADDGIDIRTSLQGAVTLGWVVGYFNIQHPSLDAFDSVRLAISSGGTEKRSASVGTPWYPIFEQVDSSGILGTPLSFDLTDASWHNHIIVGWKSINGSPYLISKSWQGSAYGDGGYCYWSRSLFNSVMGINGSVAFTATTGVLPPITTIPVSLWQQFISFWMSLIGYSYGGTQVPSFWSKFWSIIDEIVVGEAGTAQTTQTPPHAPQNAVLPPTEPSTSLLNTFCEAIKFREGANPLNNNPGNCKYYYGGYLSVYGNVTKNPHGFAVFPTYAQGWLYLQNLVRGIIRLHPTLTFYQFFAGNGDWGGYAPSTDGNDPLSYGTQVATACGQSVYNMVDIIIS